MTIDELIKKLKQLADGDPEEDPEQGHREADKLLIEYIDDKRVRRAFNSITKWYA